MGKREDGLEAGTVETAALHAEAERRSREGDVAAAVAILRRAADLAPDDPETLNRLARALHAGGLPAEALEIHGRSLRCAAASTASEAFRSARSVPAGFLAALRWFARR